MDITVPPGATPITEDDLQDLIPDITMVQELNEFEQWNIIHAIGKARRSRKLKRDLLNIELLKWLHSQMFAQTWKWAGHFRIRLTNIGVEPSQIYEQVAILCADGKYWIENDVYPLAECAVRIHHRLAKIHPFVNGNGRHARLVADLMMSYAGQPQFFTWGGESESLNIDGKIRRQYITALKKADVGDYHDLLDFSVTK